MPENKAIFGNLSHLQFSAVAVFSFYLIALVFPDPWWGTHCLKFIPGPVKLVLPVICLILILFPNRFPINFSISTKWNSRIVWAIIGGVLFYLFSIPFDHYGDSYKFYPYINDIPSQLPYGAAEDLFSFKITTSAGHKSVLALITYITYYFQISYLDTFRLVGAICGAGFLYTWLALVHKELKNKGLQLAMVLMGFSAPLLLNFFGHQEIYAPIIMIQLLLFYRVIHFFDHRNLKNYLVLLVLNLIALKLHPSALLFFPVLLVGGFSLVRKSPQIPDKVLTWKRAIMWFLIPFLILGILGYFFVFQDYNDSRELTESIQLGEDRLFLPIVSPEAPLDQYNLFSLNHLSDFFNLFFLWSPIGLVILVYALIKRRDSFKVPNPKLVASGLIWLLMVAVFFGANPLLSMPIDWDLFCIPGIAFLVFVLQIVKNWELSGSPEPGGLKSMVIAFTLLVVPFFGIHYSPDALADRYISMGRHLHTSYYDWTHHTMEYALELKNEAGNDVFEERQLIIDQLKPDASKGNDKEMSWLLADQGRDALRIKGNPDEALKFLEQAEYYKKDQQRATLYFVEAYFVKQQYDVALIHAEKLVMLQYPSLENALRIATHTALEANNYEKALQFSTMYLKHGANPLMQQVHDDIKANRNPEQLKLLFR